MRLFEVAPDGGKDSGLTGYYIIEIKSLFSIVVLDFQKGSRDAYHTHAFNAWTIWLKGKVFEYHLDGTTKMFKAGMFKKTPRSTFHKIEPAGRAWAISFRGPWKDNWKEWIAGKIRTLTNGRKEVSHEYDGYRFLDELKTSMLRQDMTKPALDPDGNPYTMKYRYKDVPPR